MQPRETRCCCVSRDETSAKSVSVHIAYTFGAAVRRAVLLGKNEPWLRRTQMWPADGKAVSLSDPLNRKSLLTEFARRVRDAVEAPPYASDEPHLVIQATQIDNRSF